MAVIERFLKALLLFCLYSLFTRNNFLSWMKKIVVVTKSQS